MRITGQTLPHPLPGAALVVAAVFAAGCGSDTTPASSPTTTEAATPATTNTTGHEHHDHAHTVIESAASDDIDNEFDLVSTKVVRDGDEFVFTSHVVEGAGTAVPTAAGQLNQAPVWSYVWPTSLDSSVVGFDQAQGILALAATSHPDFDDTPLYDEDGDGDPANDGAKWHAHWVVLTEAEACPGGLSVKAIPEGTTPTVPDTWPELPILIDSPDYTPTLSDESVEIRVPATEIGAPAEFNFDGVTSGLRVSTSPHDPLLCVEAVYDVASGDLSLPGVAKS